MKNILLTGAAGFVGFHLTQRLHSLGNRLVGLDNFNEYYDPKLKRDRAQILKQQGISIIEGDICDLQLLKKLIDSHQITHLVHLAAQAGVRYSLINPHLYLKTNVEGFVNILEACRVHPGIKLVYASSSSVYGLNKKVPFSIEDRTDRPASLYGATKKANELIAETYYHLYGIPSTGLRFFTVYGPWGRPDMSYFIFTKAILENRPIEIYNFGKMKRDFTYIDDIIEGSLAAIDREEKKCELFNLGNHRPERILYLVKLLEELLNKKAVIKLLPMQPGDVKETYANIDYSQKKLGFFPKTTLAEGMKNFVAWYLDYTKTS